jgi:hypothetical protein
VAVAVFNPDVFELARAHGRDEVTVVKILGFFIERMQGNDVVGYITHYPSIARGGTPVDSSANFLRTVILVR